eukprot:gene27502-36183_t
MVGSGEWSSGEELGQTWENRNAFSYGSSKSEEKGVKRTDLLRGLLNTTDRVIQEVDCVEYGLTDIQEYYANTGAIKKAAENNRSGRKVAVSVIKAIEPEMGGCNDKTAYEISGRMTAMLGWAGTADFKEKWVFDGAAERFALDEKMANQLKDLNPEAFRNILKRLLEANGRGFWAADSSVLSKLQELYDDVEDEIEGVL